MVKNGKLRVPITQIKKIFLLLGKSNHWDMNARNFFMWYLFWNLLLLFLRHINRYDYWYQPYHNVMISTEWGHPRSFCQGFDLDHVKNGHYGTHINVFDWKEGKLLQVCFKWTTRLNSFTLVNSQDFQEMIFILYKSSISAFSE